MARDPALVRVQLAFLGFNMAEFATWIAILVYAYDRGGAAVAGIVALVQLIPAGIVAPFAASAADRYRRDRVLVTGYLVIAAALGMTAAALYADAPFPLTIAAATLAATSLTIVRPTHASLLPIVTHTPEELTAANAVSGLAENIGVFIGPLLGGLLLARNQPGDVFAGFALTMLASALLSVRLPLGVVPVTTELPTVRNVAAELGAGFAALARERRVLLLVTLLASTAVVIGALDILVVAVAIDLLGEGSSWAGFLYAAFGLGGIVGAVGSVALIGRRRLTPSLAGSAVLLGAPISSVGLIPAVTTAPLLMAASGAGSSVVTVAGRTLLQRVAPNAVLARIFGVLEGLSMFALAAGSIAGAALIETVGIPGALLVSGLFVPIVLAIAWFELQAIDRDAPGPDPEALALLRAIPIFAPLSALAMERVLANLVRVEVPAGEVVIREGDIGDRFYVLAEGEVEVTADGRLLNRQPAPSHFGEIALLREVPRTATVTAATPLRLLTLERAPFLEAVTGHPQARESAEAVAAARIAAGARSAE